MSHHVYTDPGRHDARPLDVLSAMIAYEADELDRDDTLELFQSLVDSGMAWTLQGHYGRTASALLRQGLITGPDHGRN